MFKKLTMLAAAPVLGLAILAGCDRTISSESETKVKDDGTVIRETDKTVEKPDGSVVREKAKDVDRPGDDR